jgi:Tudor domain
MPVPKPQQSIPFATRQRPEVQTKRSMPPSAHVVSAPQQFAPAPQPVISMQHEINILQNKANCCFHTAPQPVAPPVKTATTQSILSESGIHEVQISHIENGSKIFYVQQVSQIEMIGELSKRMQASVLEQPQFLQEGLVYLLRQGSLVFRCLLVSMDPFRGRLIDFGNVVNVNYKDLFTLPKPYASLGQLAYRFALAGFSSNQQLCLNPDAVYKFKSIVRVSDKLHLKVVAADGPPTSQYCELYKNNVNILTTLIDELNKPTNYEKQSFLTNAEYEIVVSHVDTKTKTLPWTFYVQMVSETSRLESLSAELMQICNSAPQANADQLVENAPVLAKNDLDELWYRGLLLQKDAQNATVYFVDYGNTDEVALKNLRVPTRSVVKQMPEQAIRCILDGCSSKLIARDLMNTNALYKVCFLCI